ncbi:MAG: sulfatase [Chitinophagaceae bacterium]|nr:sulfatase [Chitinophagaceae bacterium]
MKLSLKVYLLFCCLYAASVNAQSKQPNIIVILADDLGYSDIGCYGSEIHTPNLDKLASQGLKLTQFYNAGRCCPSRAALLTGLYPHQAGVGDMLQNDSLEAYGTHLNYTSVTLAEVLQQAGYHTIISGKWHAGNEPEYWPTKRGFQDQYFSNGTTGHYFGIAKGRQYIVNGKEVEVLGPWIKSGNSEYKLFKNEDGSQWYATDAIADHAIDFIEAYRKEEKQKPFFLYLPFTAPHWPLHAFEEDIVKYEGRYDIGWDSLRVQRFNRMKSLGLIDPSWKISPRNENVTAWSDLSDSLKIRNARLMATYAAMVDRLDQNVGKLLESLKATGDIDNTVIIFLADNGGCHEQVTKGAAGALPGTAESFDGYEYGWANVSNTPFQWFKHWAHEGGTSTPFIAWYTKVIKAGSVNSSIGYIADIMPTLVDLAGTKYPKEYKGNKITPTIGNSLLPLFKGQPSYKGHDQICWEHEGNRAVRQGNWKLVSRYDYKNNVELPWELYDIKNDRSETNNLAKKDLVKYAELQKVYATWADQIHVVPYQKLLTLRKEKGGSKPQGNN